MRPRIRFRWYTANHQTLHLIRLNQRENRDPYRRKVVPFQLQLVSLEARSQCRSARMNSCAALLILDATQRRIGPSPFHCQRTRGNNSSCSADLDGFQVPTALSKGLDGAANTLGNIRPEDIFRMTKFQEKLLNKIDCYGDVWIDTPLKYCELKGLTTRGNISGIANGRPRILRLDRPRVPPNQQVNQHCLSHLRE